LDSGHGGCAGERQRAKGWRGRREEKSKAGSREDEQDHEHVRRTLVLLEYFLVQEVSLPWAVSSPSSSSTFPLCPLPLLFPSFCGEKKNKRSFFFSFFLVLSCLNRWVGVSTLRPLLGFFYRGGGLFPGILVRESFGWAMGVGVIVLRDEREGGWGLAIISKGSGGRQTGRFFFSSFFFEFPLVELALGERIEIAQWRTRHAMHGL